MNIWQLQWSHGRLEVQSLGAMLGPVTFKLPGGAQVQPLAIAPWAQEPEAATLPGILQRLRGEWPCVPFGATEEFRPFPPGWQAAAPQLDAAGPAHGYGSHSHWQLLEQNKQQLRLSLDYPKESPIRRLMRTITPDPGSPAIDIELQVEVRRPCRLPIGLHPVLRLPDIAGSTRLQPRAFRFGRTYPLRFEPTSRAAIDCSFDKLSRIPALDGSDLDFSRLPLRSESEEIVQLCAIDGGFELINELERYLVGIHWDPTHFPSCLLWISNRGRSAYPWNNRHLALGVEPVASAFDLNPSIALDPNNPIAKTGIATCRAFDPEQVWRTSYRLYASPATVPFND